MAQNTNPIYSLVPGISAGQLTPSITANTKSDGVGTIGTDIVKCFTADATNGSYVSKVRLQPYASAAATATIATTLRLFISSKTSGSTTAADTFCVQEIGVSSQSADHSTTATYFIDVIFNVPIPASYTILASQHAAAAANTGWQVIVFYGNY